jgi:hypothetical protein
MDDYQKLVAKALVSVDEILPWDLEEEIALWCHHSSKRKRLQAHHAQHVARL